MRTTATNIGSRGLPVRSGAHPYLTLGTETVDDVLLQVPARTALRSDERGIPIGAVAVDGTELDFRSAVGSARRSSTTASPTSSATARASPASRSRPRADRGRTLWVDESYPYVMVFTGDIPAVQRRGLAVEPMTCPPNAFRSGDALVTLEPGESTTARGGWLRRSR